MLSVGMLRSVKLSMQLIFFYLNHKKLYFKVKITSCLHLVVEQNSQVILVEFGNLPLCQVRDFSSRKFSLQTHRT